MAADLKKICESSLNLKIISFFHENPSTLDTARSIAGWLNHNSQEVKLALDYLVNQNILTSHQTGSTIAYAYTQDKEVIDRLDKILKNKKQKS